MYLYSYVLGSRLEFSCVSSETSQWGWSFEWDQKNRGPMSQLLWHDKDPLPCSKAPISGIFVCFESHEQFFSYVATVTITGDGAVNLDLCLALTAFSSEGPFKCHTYCDTGPPFLRSYPKDPWFAVLLAKEQSLSIFESAGPSGAQTYDLPDANQEHYH
jgi:hypothetical protein